MIDGSQVCSSSKFQTKLKILRFCVPWELISGLVENVTHTGVYVCLTSCMFLPLFLLTVFRLAATEFISSIATYYEPYSLLSFIPNYSYV